jgi:hypothetical protein
LGEGERQKGVKVFIFTYEIIIFFWGLLPQTPSHPLLPRKGAACRPKSLTIDPLTPVVKLSLVKLS